jgi:hypothetical protein
MFFIWLEERTELSRWNFMNLMLESVKGDWKELFDSWKWHYEFTSVAIKKIMKMLHSGIILHVGKKIRSNNSSVGRSERKGPL